MASETIRCRKRVRYQGSVYDVNNEVSEKPHQKFPELGRPVGRAFASPALPTKAEQPVQFLDCREQLNRLVTTLSDSQPADSQSR
jgi:hypothetical protein